MEGSCRAEGEKEKGKKREGRKIGKVGNRWLSLMRSLPGEWKQEKLRTGGGLQGSRSILGNLFKTTIDW